MKAQIDIEILVSVGIVFLLFIAIISITNNFKANIVDANKVLEKRSECFKISNIINSVYSNGNNASVVTYTNFMISIDPNNIEVGQTIKITNETPIGYYCCHPNECDLLGQELTSRFNVSTYIYSGCGDNDQIRKLLNETYKYDHIALEDPQLQGVDVTNLNNFVAAGKNVYISENVKTVLFGIDFDKATTAGLMPNTVVNEDYRLNLTIGDQLVFRQTKGIVESKVDITNFVVIANHSKPNTITGIATWDYGKGKPIYFTDFDESGPINFTKLVVDSIEEDILSKGDFSDSYKCSYKGKILLRRPVTGNIKITNKKGIVYIEKQ